MPTNNDTSQTKTRRMLPKGLAGLAGLACVACCAIPALLAAGVIAGAGWAALVSWLPGLAIVFAAMAALTWWWTTRRQAADGCTDGDCSCATAPAAPGDLPLLTTGAGEQE